MPQRNSSNFTEAVKKVVRTIKKGDVLTYKEVATKAGNMKAARAVALIMSKNFDTEIPCHRVIRSDGKVGGYNRGGEAAKASLLYAEGWNQQFKQKNLGVRAAK